MKCIFVDDEPILARKFLRLTKDIEEIESLNTFRDSYEALEFAENNKVDLAFLDIGMPSMNGIELAKRLKEIRSDMIIVFATAYEGYIREANELSADYYLMKPYEKKDIENVVSNMFLLSARQQKDIYIQMFGHFVVKKNNEPVPLTGKAKEILALIVSRHGKGISNDEIYSTIWENRPCDNSSMVVYFNALRRLKNTLKKYGMSDILIPTPRGQIANIDIFDCDFYAWKAGDPKVNNLFDGEFLTEYHWGEEILAEIIHSYWSL